MKISVIQMDMQAANPDYNFAHAEELVRAAAAGRPDVVVLPETWNTGFFPRENLAAYCDRDGQRVRSVFGPLARELDVNIVAGSVSNLRGDQVCNSAYVFDRQGGLVAEYDKTHLFTPMGEHQFYQAGGNLCTFELDGRRCGLIICYDLRFLELVRSLALTGLDLLFVPAQWPAKRRFHWVTLNTARAIENQMFVVACNSCGRFDETQYGGSSLILDPWGETIAAAGQGEETISGELDFSIIEGIRSSINVYNDRRPDLYFSRG